MPNRILVPIDFKVESLNTLKYALCTFEEEVEVVLMYSEHLTDSIVELMFYSPDEKRKKLNSTEFQEALTVLNNRYESILTQVSIEFFHGFNTASFKNFVRGHKIDKIFIPKSYSFQPYKNGFNPISIIKKSKLPYHEVEWQNVSDITSNELSFLFNQIII